jgi:hypothetical protein
VATRGVGKAWKAAWIARKRKAGGEWFRVALNQAEVNQFMAAEKVVPGSASMEWRKPEPSRYMWDGPIEIQAARVGTIFLFANPHFPRYWIFKLTFRGEDVYRWDIRPMPGGHDNPPGRPAGYPKSVPEPEHEHVWHERMALRCARPLAGLATSDHRAIFEAFCGRTHVRFGPDYVAPQAYEQSRLPI